MNAVLNKNYSNLQKFDLHEISKRTAFREQMLVVHGTACLYQLLTCIKN